MCNKKGKAMKFKLFYKPKQEYVLIYDIRYEKNGYPQFLIYMDGEWLVCSAKYFAPKAAWDNESINW